MIKTTIPDTTVKTQCRTEEPCLTRVTRLDAMPLLERLQWPVDALPVGIVPPADTHAVPAESLASITDFRPSRRSLRVTSASMACLWKTACGSGEPVISKQTV